MDEPQTPITYHNMKAEYIRCINEQHKRLLVKAIGKGAENHFPVRTKFLETRESFLSIVTHDERHIEWVGLQLHMYYYHFPSNYCI